MIAADPIDSLPSTRYGAQAQPRRRALALTIALHALVALLFLIQKREPIAKMGEEGLKTFNIAPEGPKGSETEKSERKAEEQTKRKQAASQTQPVVAETPPPPSQPPPVVKDFQPSFLVLSSDDYAASNIGAHPSQKIASAAANGQGDSKAPAGPGSGPGGSTLYPADWYREPTDTELGGYIRPDMPRSGWGMIACKTVAQHHVEDCYILGESPRGSGFGRSVLNAAWQFLVLAPRINGREQVGTWVSIRITYTDGNAKAGPG